MTTSVDVKHAVEQAASYFARLTSAEDIRLEEVELSDDERSWLITLSGLVPSPKTAAEANPQMPLSGLTALFGRAFERVYKLFIVDAADGAVKSMKIRKLE